MKHGHELSGQTVYSATKCLSVLTRLQCYHQRDRKIFPNHNKLPLQKKCKSEFLNNIIFPENGLAWLKIKNFFWKEWL